MLHGYLGTYSRYIADDFCSAGMARRLGVLRAVWYWYLNWTGRYSASALDAVFGLLGPAVTPMVTGLVLLIWLAALAHATAALLAQFGDRRIIDALLIASTIVYATLTVSPNVPQSLYWGQGMRSIVPPLILSTLLVDYITHLSPLPVRGGGKLWLVGSLLLTLLIGGFNETFAALQLGALACAGILARVMPGWTTRKSLTELLLAGALGAAVALVIIVMSPGNAIRQAMYPPPPALPKLILLAWENFGAFLAGLIRAPEKVLAMCGVLAASAFMGSQLPQRPPSRLTAGVILAAGMGLAFASFFPAAYGLSDSPPERTLLVPAHLLTLTLVLEGLFLGSLLGQTAMQPGTRHIATAVLLMACVLLVSSSVLSIGRLRVSGPDYVAYAEHWDAVDAQILSAEDRGERQIWIQPIANWAGLNEPNDNPKFWLNVCLREYYGIEVLGLDIH
jgi:hypothetical protein